MALHLPWLQSALFSKPSPPPPPPPPPPPFSLLKLGSSSSPPSRSHASKKDTSSFTDQLLDYIEGGPKLRKWYGAPDLLPKDGGAEAEEDELSEVNEVRDAILVTDGESELGQMVILSLILKRSRVKTLVKDKRSAIEAFGTYIEDGYFSEIARTKGVEHIVLLSQLAFYRGSSGLQAIMNNKIRKLAEKDEEIVIASGIPYTIIRAGSLQDSPGGKEGFSFGKDAAEKGKLSKEDAAMICVEALSALPSRGLIVEVVNGQEEVPDWKEKFQSLIESGEELQ